VKTFLALLLTCFGALAQIPAVASRGPNLSKAEAAEGAVFAPLPAQSTNASQAELLRRALDKPGGTALNVSTNVVSTNANAPSTNAPEIKPAAAVPAPVPTLPILPARPVVTAASTNAPASNPLLPVPGVPAPSRIPPPGLQPAVIPGVTSGTNVVADEVLPAGTINFPATDLNQVLQIYSELVGRTVLRPTSLPAPTITLKTQTPLTRREAVQAFDAVLALNGIAVVNVGDKFVKVVPNAQAGQIGAAFNKESPDQLPDLGQFVTEVLQVTNVKPSDLIQVLTPFASPGLANGILPIDPSQILVLRDYSENVKRMLEMVKKVDVTVPPEFIQDVIPIKYALASDIANAINTLSTGGGGTSIGSSGATGTTTGIGGSRGSYGSGMRNTGLGGVGGVGGYPGSLNPQGTTSAYGNQGALGGAAQRGGTGGSFTQRLQNIINKAATSGEIQVLGQTKIIADERTNSLLIFASREDMKQIKEIVAKLDVVLAQVLIEAVVIEVSLNGSRDLGVSYLQTSPKGNDYFRGIGAINNNNIFTNTAGVFPGGFSYLASLGNDLDIYLTAVQANSRARILQRPRIQTSHAVPASIFVGESRPYPQGSYYGGGSFGGYSTIQQLQIGVTLEVTPLINPDGLVVMDIHQRIDSFKGNVTIQGVGDVPITSEKDAAAKVAVRDHDTIMLGGLIETDKNANNSGVPFLKDIPFLGYFFRASHTDSTRSELMVLIRPTVLPTPEVAALAAISEKNKMPGVKRMEEEVQQEENKRLRSHERDPQVQ
jgi:general secretion pathway protein D